MTLDQLVIKMTEYSISTLVPKATSPVAKFMLGAAPIGMAKKVQAVAVGMDCINANGEVDLDTLYAAMSSGFKAAGQISVLGGLLSFDSSDLDGLYKFLKG